MNLSFSPTQPAAAIAPAEWSPPALDIKTSRWRNWIAPALSFGILIASLVQLRSLDLHRALALLPTSPLFWLAFLGAYFTLPVSEWLIYRRLWNLPRSGFSPLLRKRLSNELLLGYSGELYFYGWARRNAGLTTAPFGAIKDVAILSAQAGNIATLALLVMAWPWLGALQLGVEARALLMSTGAVMLLSVLPVLLRRHMLSLPAAELRWIGAIHLARIAISLALAAFFWHEALPDVALRWWLILSALRQLVSRLPLVPNKDIVFAGLAAYLVGPRADLTEMIAMTATVTLAIHIGLGIVLAATGLAPAPAAAERD